MKNTRILRIGVSAAVLLVLIYLFTLLTDDTRGFQKVDTSVAMAQLEAGNAEEVRIDDREQRLRVKLKEPISDEGRDDVTEIVAEYPARASEGIFDAVRRAAPGEFDTHVSRESFLMSMVSFLLPMLLLFGLLMFFLSRMQGGGMFGFGASKAKELTKDMPTNTFGDVAGADDAVDELQEIKDFLEDPERYHELGAKIPRGVLLYGPPGTGKTLLARAVAGEAGVPFYSISGSDFVEMFVGVGASRVRDLFKQARENSPCIIFVDEIDAVGRQRGSGIGGGHDEREQTLNQLLVEMDGFGDREGVILIAATNRPDILDPALLRPGRFDRQIPVTAPDLAGREAILKVHSEGKPLADDVDLRGLAKRTAGMSGADLANVLNEAALLTARIGGNIITPDALEEATDRVIGGPRRSSKIISEKEKKVTAYHEGGHTLSAWAIEDIERVYKVTILARGRTGGHAMTAAEDDKGMYNRDELFARLVFAMGGRAAEELVFGEPTTGASADIEQATRIARAMVTEYGMSAEVGPVKYGEEQGDPFSGRPGGGSLDHSPQVAARIDEEVRRLLDLAHERSYRILARYRDHLDRLAEKLLEKETLRRPDLEVLFEDIEPERVGGELPGEDPRFARQIGREPVKTPAELAIERGEEPPRPFSLLDASREARARRLAEKERAREKTDDGDEDAPRTGSRPAGRDGAASASPAAPKPAPSGGWGLGRRASGPAEHPGLRNYPAAGEGGDAPASTAGRHHRPEPGSESERDARRDGDGEDDGAGATELIGFRLPERERPDHPEGPGEEDTRVVERPGRVDEGSHDADPGGPEGDRR